MTNKQTQDPQHRLINVRLDAIRESPKNPRLTIKKNAFDELKASIFANGLLQPIAVRLVDDAHEIVGGHRRFLAVKELAQEHPGDGRFETVPALVIDASDERVAALRLAENVNREDLSPHEVAEGVMDALETGITEEELAESLGWGKRNVYRYTEFHGAPPWLDEFTRSVPDPVKKLDDQGKVVIDAATGKPKTDVKKLPALSITHVTDLITLYNTLHEHDEQKFVELGSAYKAKAELVIHTLARTAAKEEWSTLRLRKEIASVKAPPTRRRRPSMRRSAARRNRARRSASRRARRDRSRPRVQRRGTRRAREGTHHRAQRARHHGRQDRRRSLDIAGRRRLISTGRRRPDCC
jgi:ParB/RepB/Spo0J family partition protein